NQGPFKALWFFYAKNNLSIEFSISTLSLNWL
ncbi:MAG: hypothetical protein ACI83W_000688, partial [Marinoscillum sp.]